jgi:sec-independent protein translocase protein TatA
MGNIGVVQLLIVAVIVILLFGTKKLRGIGSDLGGAIKGFKKAVSEDNEKTPSTLDNKASNTAEKTTNDVDKKTAEKEQV